MGRGRVTLGATLSPSQKLAGGAGRGLIALMIVLPLLAVLPLAIGGEGRVDLGSLLPVALRSVLVAASSAALALVLGLPGAWLLARFEYRGRALHAALHAIPLAMPAVLFLLGFIAAWGSEGFFARAIALLGIEYRSEWLYSLGGVIFVQGCYNAPLASLILARVWENMGTRLSEAARSLGARPLAVFHRVTLPSLRGALLAAFAIIFLYCFMSFVIPLTLGGGPRGETIEVSIYAAVRNSLDFGSAALLVAIETFIAFGMLAIYARFSGSSRDSGGVRAPKRRLATIRPLGRILAAAYILVEAVLAAGPLVALALSSLFPRAGRAAAPRLGASAWAQNLQDADFWASVGGSLQVAIPAAILAVFVALLVVYGSRQRAGSLIALAPLALSSTALALGYLALFPAGGPPLLYSLIAAVAAIPLAAGMLQETRAAIPRDLTWAARGLGAGRIRAFLRVDAAILGAAIAGAFASSLAIALGEVNSLLILPAGDFSTLALRAFRLMGSYRFDAAAVAGSALALLALVFFALAQASARGRTTDGPAR